MQNGRLGLVLMLGLVALAPAASAAEDAEDMTMGEAQEERTIDLSITPQPPVAAELTAAADVETATPASAPTPEQIRQVVTEHIEDIASDEGAFTLEDETDGQVRTLELVQVGADVKQSAGTYIAEVHMKDAATGEQVDVDFDVAEELGAWEVVDVRIRQVNGNPRYTYDANNNRVPTTN